MNDEVVLFPVNTFFIFNAMNSHLLMPIKAALFTPGKKQGKLRGRERQREREKMVCSYFVRGIIPALFGLAVLYKSRKNGKNRGALEGRMRCEGLNSSSNGECSQQITEPTDVIIVGAGVAGSALAHTLGKVTPSLSLSCLTYCHFISPCLIAEKMQEMKG